MKKAQISLETIIISSYTLLTALALIALFSYWYIESNEKVDVTQAEQTARIIADNINEVSLMGEETKTTFKIFLPKSIYNFSVGNKEVFLRLKLSHGYVDVVENINTDIFANISKQHATYTLIAESRGNFTCVYVDGRYCPICKAGETKKCNTGHPGICELGERTCTDGEFGSCTDLIIPGDRLEICDNFKDDDCDGAIDEGC